MSYGIIKAVGRGRGRLVPQEVLDAPLRKPGMPLPERTNVSDKLAKLDILFNGPVDSLLVYRVLDEYLLRGPCTELDIHKMMEYIFKRVLSDSSNADNICKYLFVMFRHEIKGHALRSVFYSYLQKNYKESSRIKLNYGPLEYRNFILMFAAATHHARNINFAPIDEMIEGLLLLAVSIVPTISQEDIEVFSLCVIRYSQYLKLTKSSGSPVNNVVEKIQRLESAQNIARQVLFTCDISKTSVAWLCMVIECKHITNDLLEQQYFGCLGKSINMIKPEESLRIMLPRADFDRFSLSSVSSFIELV